MSNRTVKDHPDTKGMWLDFCYKVGDLMGRPLKKGEHEIMMNDFYIRNLSPEECAKLLRRRELMG